MGTAYKGVNYTNLTGSIPKLAEEGQQGGIKKVIYDTFVLTADLAAGDTIAMGGLIPPGSIILDCILAFGAMGGSCTVNVGWNASADAVESAQATGFFSAAAVSSAGSLNLQGSGGQSTAIGKKFSSAVQPVIAENAVSSGATGKAFWLAISYIES